MADPNYQLWLRFSKVRGHEANFHTDLVLEKLDTSGTPEQVRYLSGIASRQDGSSLDGIIIPRGPTEGWGYLQIYTRMLDGGDQKRLEELHVNYRGNILDDGADYFQLPLSVPKSVLDSYGGDYERLWQAMVEYGDKVSLARLPYRPLSNNSNTFARQTMSVFGLEYANKAGYRANKYIATTYDPITKVVTSESSDREHAFVFDVRSGAAGYHRTTPDVVTSPYERDEDLRKTTSEYFDTPGVGLPLNDSSGMRRDLQGAAARPLSWGSYF